MNFDSIDHMDWDNLLQYVSDHDPVERPKSELGGVQVPTPPVSLFFFITLYILIHISLFKHSQNSSPLLDKPSALVSVSTTFFPGAQLHSLSPDAILLSSDSVFFYVHSHILLQTSDNRFHSLLPSSFEGRESIVDIPETSVVLNIILHTIYEMSCSHYSPTFSTLITAVTRLPYYGINPKSRISPSTQLYILLLSYAPLYPIELYALAASFDLYDLAVSTSSHLLSFPLWSLSDEMAENIGPIYLKRLFFLHFGRIEALKRVLLPPPLPHPPTQWCDFADQKKVTRAWALAAAYLAWDARPGQLLIYN